MREDDVIDGTQRIGEAAGGGVEYQFAGVFPGD
jgi:hypothetical protein